MSQPPYRALRIMLDFLSLLMTVGGVVLIFSGKPLILRLFLHPPEAEISTLLLFTLKEMGGFALMLSVLLFFAARDPQRNLAIVDALTVGSFHPERYTFAVPSDARHPEDLSCTPHLGPIRGEACARGSPLLSATAGETLGTCGEFLSGWGLNFCRDKPSSLCQALVPRSAATSSFGRTFRPGGYEMHERHASAWSRRLTPHSAHSCG